jgi:predicted neutral ceramidase superfamily lipid hydrolase
VVSIPFEILKEHSLLVLTFTHARSTDAMLTSFLKLNTMKISSLYQGIGLTLLQILLV